MNHPIEGMIPPGGWHYVDRLDGIRVPLDGGANDYRDLLDSVLHRRLANRLPVGDVQADVDEYICSNFPAQCGIIHNPIPNIPHTDQTRYIDRISQALIKLQDSGVKLVSRELATQRAQSCLQCPHNVEWENQCPSCVGSAKQLSHLIRQGQDLGVKHLKSCRLHNLPLDTACLIESPEKPQGLPEHCWNK